MRTTLISSLAAIFMLACSAGGTGVRRDSGTGSGLDGGTTRDAGGPIFRDSGPPTPPRDTGPPGPDSGCTATSPVGATIIGDPPDMLLIVDVSGSMCSPLFGVGGPGGFVTKLAIMKDALDTLVTSKEARINFGLMLYPQGGACGPGVVRNDIAPRNASAINSTLGGLNDNAFGCAFSNSGATPTHTSVDAARSYYTTIPANPVGRYALLATDGLPNCGPEIPDAGGATEETVDETVAAIEALHAAGITTYVLGFGADFGSDPDALRRMAVAGGTSSPFSATSAAALDAALDMIAAEIIPPSCTVELEGAARDPRLFQVRFDGGPLIPRNEARTSGWDYDAATNTITFYGAECTAVESGSVTSIDVDFGCPGPLI